MLIGYARVSTAEQNLDLQTDTLNRAVCEKLFTDKAGSARAERPGLDQALAHLRKGDTLVVWKLDRLGRSIRHLIETVGQLQERKNGRMAGRESTAAARAGDRGSDPDAAHGAVLHSQHADKHPDAGEHLWGAGARTGVCAARGDSISRKGRCWL